jgi:lipid II isoglutaminyl synthase (glutamine-hydrolysing)
MIARPRLRLAYLYPRLLNLYSDAGNVVCLQKRCTWRDIDLSVDEIDVSMSPNFEAFDIAFIGGGEDRQQTIAARDIVVSKADGLRAALDGGLVCLAVCGGYQLLADYYKPADGDPLPGIGHFKAYTEHAGPGTARFVGNVAARRDGKWLVGFENHGGRTTLTGSRPLAKIVAGAGNNGVDGHEGAVEGNAIGTYLHGSLLPKNPDLADELIALALRRKGIEEPLRPLDDSVELRARSAMLSRLKLSA